MIFCGKPVPTFPDHALTRTPVVAGFEPRIGQSENSFDQSKAPEECPGLFSLPTPSKPQVRVRIRIMKLSKLSSATCIHNSESVR